MNHISFISRMTRPALALAAALLGGNAQAGRVTLKNALNALGALLILTFHFYTRVLATPPNTLLAPKDATAQLTPESTLMRLHESNYYANLIV